MQVLEIERIITRRFIFFKKKVIFSILSPKKFKGQITIFFILSYMIECTKVDLMITKQKYKGCTYYKTRYIISKLVIFIRDWYNLISVAGPTLPNLLDYKTCYFLSSFSTLKISSMKLVSLFIFILFFYTHYVDLSSQI